MSGGFSKYNGYAFVIIRLMLGIIFFTHGLQKFGAFGGSGVDSVISNMEKIGFSFPGFLGWTYCLVELIGGIFLVFGLFPRTVSFLQIIYLSLMFWKVDSLNGFFMTSKGGMEFSLLLIICAIAIFLNGAGALASYDKY